jgi:hypothetical protein
MGGFGHEGTNTDGCCVCMGGGGGNCGAEGVYACAMWNTCAGTEGWKTGGDTAMAEP